MSAKREPCLAYHRVRSGPKGVKPTLRDGVLLPPIDRIARSAADKEADYFFREILIAPRTVFDLALRQIYEREASELSRKGDRWLGLSFSNIIAGDLRTVFFTPHNWYQPYSDEIFENGFAFRCEDLLAMGGCYREWDIGGPVFDDVLAPLMESGSFEGESIASMERKLVEEIARAKAKYTFCGPAALKKLAWKGDWIAQRPEAEIAIEGPVPLDLAVEIWENGKQIA